MSTHCHDRCKAVGGYTKKSGYRDGKKYCSTCVCWMTLEGIWCPCCSQRVRSTPKNSKKWGNRVMVYI